MIQNDNGYCEMLTITRVAPRVALLLLLLMMMMMAVWLMDMMQNSWRCINSIQVSIILVVMILITRKNHHHNQHDGCGHH